MEFERISADAASPRLQDVLGVDARGEELRAIIHHRGEHALSVRSTNVTPLTSTMHLRVHLAV